MKNFKEAWTLIKFEYKMTPPSYISAFLMLALSLSLAMSTLTGVEEQATLGTEILFIVIVVIFPYLFRSEQMQAKNIGNKKNTSPIVVLVQTMAVSNKTIATYRMTSFTIMTLAFNSLFFILFYALTPYIRSIAPLNVYIVFVLMWICFAIYAGGFQVHMEAGFHFITHLLVDIFLVIPFLLIMGALLFYKTYTNGLIQWMLDISTDYPLVAIGASIALAIAGYAFHIRRFMKRMEKTDY